MKLPESDFYELEKLEIAKIIRNGLKLSKNKDVSDIRELYDLITKLKGLKLSEFDESKLKKLAENYSKRMEGADVNKLSFMQKIINLINYFDENGGDRNKTLNELFGNVSRGELLSRSVSRAKYFLEKFKGEFGFKLLTLLTAYLDSEGYAKRRYFMQVLKLFFDKEGNWVKGSEPYRKIIHENLKDGFFKIGNDNLEAVSVGTVFPTIVYNYIRVLCGNKINNANFICRDELKKGLNDSMSNGFFSVLYDLPFSINNLERKNLVVSVEKVVEVLNEKVEGLYCFIFAYYPKVQDLKSEDFLTSNDAFNKKFLNRFDNFFKELQKQLFDDFVKKSDYKNVSKKELGSESYLNSLMQDFVFALNEVVLGRVENKELADYCKKFSEIKAFQEYSYNEKDRTDINNFFSEVRDKAKKSDSARMQLYIDKFTLIINNCAHADKTILVRDFWKHADNLINNANITDFKSFYNLVVDLVDLNKENLEKLKTEFEAKKQEYNNLNKDIIDPLVKNFTEVSNNLNRVGIGEDVESLFKNLVNNLFDSAGYSNLDAFEKMFKENFERFDKIIKEKKERGAQTISDLNKKSWNAFKKQVDDFGVVSESKAEQLFSIFKKMNNLSQTLKTPVTELPDLPSKDASRDNFINALKKGITTGEKPVSKTPFVDEKENVENLLVVNTNVLISSIVDSIAENVDKIDSNNLESYAIIGKLLFKSFLKLSDDKRVVFEYSDQEANAKYVDFKNIFNNLSALSTFADLSLEAEV
ncbi:MAG: hypothetical protein JW791_00870 [Nanoarchaeota archaeon]|nr:hypothetical protein [Nanoarchaeota archaeon]